MRQIVVSGHCQTAGIAAALNLLLPGDAVRGLQLDTSGGGGPELLDAVRNADVWIHAAPESFLQEHGLARPGLQCLGLPLVFFNAFHPDVCPLRQISTGKEYLEPGYHSVIAAWAWQHGLLPHEVAPLFNTPTFAALGYFDRWQASVAYQRRLFEDAGWAQEFPRFFLEIQRTGCFMHSINHPRVHVLVRLAKMLASHLGAGDEAWERDVVVHDNLTIVTWPLYPPVADCLGLGGGGWHWRFYDERHAGITAMVEAAYSAYARQNLGRADVEIGGFDAALLDRVLAPQCGVKV